MKSLVNKSGPKGIREDGIDPGRTWTERFGEPVTDWAKRSGATVDKEKAKITGEVPLIQMGTVEEYGRAIAWLASPVPCCLHGHALIFDGGITKTAL